MKKSLQSYRAIVLLSALAALLQGCIKDTGTRTYTLYVPVYKTVAEVWAGMKSNAAAAITNPGKIFVKGNYIFLNEIDKGVHIIDNSNPAAPVNKYFVSIPGNLDLAIRENILYADNYQNLVAFDISDPANVQVKKGIGNIFPRRQYANGFIGDTTKVIVDWIKKDTAVVLNEHSQVFTYPGIYYSAADVQNLSADKSSVPGVSGSMARFTLLDNYLYTVTDNSLNVFNVSAPANPVFINKADFGWGIETISPYKNNLFVGSQSGVFIFSAANPALPVLLSQFMHVTRCDPVMADDNFAYSTIRSGTACGGNSINELNIVNIQNITSPWLIKSYPLVNPYGLTKSGNTLFICDGTAGLKVFDAADVTNLRLVQTVGGIEPYDVITQDNNAIVVAKNGLYQYNFTNRSNLILQSQISYVNNR